jgi:ferredoxin
VRNPDDPYIETIRCSTCNECTLLNPRMFAYNENKQAYIVDVKAGTYAQLVQAAESCQVSVIHPGKPWDLMEPGLDELIERAKPFL